MTRCKDCIYWEAGECHKSPPHVFGHWIYPQGCTYQEFEAQTWWPRTGAERGCGRGREKPEEPRDA